MDNSCVEMLKYEPALQGTALTAEVQHVGVTCDAG